MHTYTVDHEVHDGLGHEVADGLVDDADVGVHQVPDGLHLLLQLGVDGETTVSFFGALAVCLKQCSEVGETFFYQKVH